MNWITNSAAMLVLESGSRMSRKKRKGPAPAMRAAPASPPGTGRENGRAREVPGAAPPGLPPGHGRKEVAAGDRRRARAEGRKGEPAIGIQHAEIGHDLEGG